MTFQPIRCTARDVTTTAGELLPRLFTLPPASRGGHFLLHYYTLTDIFPLGSMVLCVARTFLSGPLRFRNDGTANCITKIQIFKEMHYYLYFCTPETGSKMPE